MDRTDYKAESDGCSSNSCELYTAINNFLQEFKLRNQATIVSYEAENFLPSGTNYMSNILRLKIIYQTETDKLSTSIIIKIPLSNSPLENVFENASPVYKRENYMYANIFPQLYDLWAGEPFTPSFYMATQSNIVFLEDLQKSGFTMSNKLELDYHHSKMVIKTIAELHALGTKHFEKYGETQDLYSSKGNRTTEFFAGSVLKFYNKFLETAKPIISAQVFERLHNYKKEYGKWIDIIFTADINGWNTLCHGDPWPNNMLFQYDEEKQVTNLKLIDWQMSRRVSPVVDLIYFTTTGVHNSLIPMKLDELFKLYLETINRTLRSLNCSKIYNEEKLRQALQKHKFVFIHMIGFFRPAVEIGSFYPTESDLDTMFTSEYYQKYIRHWLKYLVEENLI